MAKLKEEGELFGLKEIGMKEDLKRGRKVGKEFKD